MLLTVIFYECICARSGCTSHTLILLDNLYRVKFTRSAQQILTHHISTSCGCAEVERINQWYTQILLDNFYIAQFTGSVYSVANFYTLVIVIDWLFDLMPFHWNKWNPHSGSTSVIPKWIIVTTVTCAENYRQYTKKNSHMAHFSHATTPKKRFCGAFSWKIGLFACIPPQQNQVYSSTAGTKKW